MDTVRHPITPSASPPLSRRKRQRTADFDLHSARRDASRKVLDLWSNLADRYSRRLDEDDIIDLRTVSLVKDRGVIRSSPRKFDFGFLTDNEDPVQPDADIDELDALPTDELNKKKSVTNVPPLQPMDPADAEDLRAFLEDEKRRKALCGEEEAGDDDDDDDSVPVADDDTDPDDAQDPHTGGGTASPSPNNHTSHTVDSESEDELGKWVSDEGTKVYQLVKGDPESDSDIEIIASTLQAPESTPSRPKPRPFHTVSREPAPLQIPPPSSPLTQLQTPPQSSSSVLENTPDDHNSAVPNHNPSPAKPRPKPIRAPEEKQHAPNPTLNLADIVNQATARSRRAKSRPRLIPVVVVPRYASLRPKRQQPTVETTAPISMPPNPPDETDSEVEIVDEQHGFTAQDKGKAKAKASPSPPPAERVTPSSEQSSDDPLALVPSSSPTKSPPTTPTQDQKKASPSSSPLWTPSRMPRPARTFSGRGRKRKRAWSSPEASDVEDVPSPAKASNPVPDHPEDLGVFRDIDDFPALASSSGVTLDAFRTPTKPKTSAKTTSKVGQGRQRRRSQLRTEPSEMSTTPTARADETTSEALFPDISTPSEPHTPRQVQAVVTRRRRGKYSSPPPPAASSAAFNPFQDPRAQYIISQAVEQLSRLVTPAPMGVPTWPPPPLPAQWEGGYEHRPALLQYQHGQWMPYTPRHGHSRSRHLSSSPPPRTRTRSRSSSPTRVYDPAFSGGTVPPSSPDPGALSLPPSSSPPLLLSSSSPPRPKSLVGRSKSRGRRVSFRLEEQEGDERGAEEEEEGGVRRGHGRALRRSVSSSHVETVSLHGHHDVGGSPGRARRVRTRVRVREEEEEELEYPGTGEEEEEEWSYAVTEPVRGRRVLRAQTPGPPSRRPSLRPATPPRNVTGAGSSRGSSHRRD